MRTEKKGTAPACSVATPTYIGQHITCQMYDYLEREDGAVFNSQPGPLIRALARASLKRCSLQSCSCHELLADGIEVGVGCAVQALLPSGLASRGTLTAGVGCQWT
jgi:hypothetical protein